MLTRRLLALVRLARTAIVKAAALGVAIVVTFVGQGLCVAGVLSRVIDHRSVRPIVVLVITFVALQCVRIGLSRWRDRIGVEAANVVKGDVRRRLYGKLLRLGPAYSTGERTGMIQTTLVDSVDRLDRYVAAFLPLACSAVIGSTGITIVIVVLDPLVGSIVAASAIVVLVAPLLTRRLVQRSMVTWTSEYRDLYSDSLDTIQGMTTLKAFDAHRRRERSLREQGKRFADASLRLVAFSTVHEGALGAASTVGTTVAIVVGSYQLADHDVGVVTLLVLLMLTRECFRPLVELQRAFHGAYGTPAAGRQIYELFDQPEPLAEHALPPARVDPRPGFSFEDVSFRYRPVDRPALDAINLAVEPGETVALVGRSGSGKSTAVQLLLRFIDPESGRVLVGGVDVRAIPTHQLHERIAVVAQDTYLFHGSVRANLLVARPGATAGEIRDALRSARAAEFVDALPEGLETQIGERGIRLSGGQRQRLAIARALLADAPLLVLDEATSSVDAANEASIQVALDRLRIGRTCLIVAHRLSTVRSADRVVVVDRGRIVEIGTPDELLRCSGAFSRMVAAQDGAR